MPSYVDFINKINNGGIGKFGLDETIHASLSVKWSEECHLEKAVNSLISQVDCLHVFLDGFSKLPGCLNHEKIFYAQSEDFGNLGESGKYYWTGELVGYIFICSPSLVYPNDYVRTIVTKIDDYNRKAVVGYSGYQICKPFQSFDLSTRLISEFENWKSDTQVSILKDSCLAFHSSTLKINRHHFYQPELSSLWFSVIAHDQNVPRICLSHSNEWICTSGAFNDPLTDLGDPNNYRTFLTKTAFLETEESRSCDYNFNSYFDKIFIMNLDRRPDRWDKVSKYLKKHGIQVERVSAEDGYKGAIHKQFDDYLGKNPVRLPEGLDPIKGYLENYRKYDHYISRIHFIERMLGRKAMASPGIFGYHYTYINIIKHAIKKDYRRIMVFDDDVLLHYNFNILFKKVSRTLPSDWLLIMLGAMQHHWGSSWIDWYNESLYHCNGTSIASHATGIDAKAFLPLLYYTEKFDLPFDEGPAFHVQSVHADKCFVFYPNLAIQDVSESDINGSSISSQEILRRNNLFKWEFENYKS